MIRRRVSQALGRKQMAFSKGGEEFPDTGESYGSEEGRSTGAGGLGRGKQPRPSSPWQEG